MGLRAKFNLVLLLGFAIGMSGIGLIAYEVLQRNAQAEVLDTAQLMMESAGAVRQYTIHEIRPLLNAQPQDKFLPQTVPAYAAMRNIEVLRRTYPKYTYKEATLNPTNPVDRATQWETSVVEYFRNNPSTLKLIGQRQDATGPSVYIAHPIQVKDASCLACHGKVNAAPIAMKARYGSANGFGWKLNEIVGAQIVSVPMSVPLARAERTLWAFLGAAGAVFALIILMLNLMLHRIVIAPVRRMSAIAHDVSMGKMDVPECTPRGKDEIASLAESFNRMRRSLNNAMRMLQE